MSVEIRTVTDEEFENWSRAEARGFGAHASDEYVRIARSFAELDRTFAAYDGEEIVGTTTTRTFTITTPGGSVKLGFVDDVTVLPTHRRRGIMTRMMRAQLSQMRERGEPLAALTASESLIYERFGFGIATWVNQWKIDRRHTAMRIPPRAGGALRFISPETAREEWPQLHARARKDRVGMVHYDAGYWRFALGESEILRRGATEFFHVAYLRGDHVAGLCSYRIWESAVRVIFLLGEDAEVEAELWRFCFGIDLITEIHAFAQPTDDPLPWRLEDPRRLQMSMRDHIWLRLVDVREALVSRGYAEPGGLTLRVHDKFCPWNDALYTLEGSPAVSECTRSGSAPQIELGVSDLAAAYLGGVSFSTLARAGRVEEHTPGAMASADRMFRTGRSPWSLEL